MSNCSMTLTAAGAEKLARTKLEALPDTRRPRNIDSAVKKLIPTLHELAGQSRSHTRLYGLVDEHLAKAYPARKAAKKNGNGKAKAAA